MNKSEIIAIAALGRDTRFICAKDKLIWHNPVDLKRVKELTLGHPLIMGRKTHESIGFPLPNRTNIILTRNKAYQAKGCIVAHTADEAITVAQAAIGGEKIFIFGGAEIYQLFLNQTDKLMLTLVASNKPGDKQFPKYKNDFILTKNHGGGEFAGESFEWVDYIKKTK